MNRDEMKEILGEVGILWPAMKLTESTVDVWQNPLSDYTIDEVRKAVSAYGREGKRFPPTPFEVEERIEKPKLKVTGDSTTARRLLEGSIAMGLRVCMAPHQQGAVFWLRRVDHVRETGRTAVIYGLKVDIYAD